MDRQHTDFRPRPAGTLRHETDESGPRRPTLHIPQFYFEDFVPGQKVHTGGVTLSEGEIIDFALRFDPQPFHLNEEAARGSVFKGLAASGWHTAPMTMRLLVESELKPVGGIAASDSRISLAEPRTTGRYLASKTSKCSRYGLPSRAPIKVSSR